MTHWACGAKATTISVADRASTSRSKTLEPSAIRQGGVPTAVGAAGGVMVTQGVVGSAVPSVGVMGAAGRRRVGGMGWGVGFAVGVLSVVVGG